MISGKTFFSYSRSDSDFALKLVKDLRYAGVEVWIDQLDIKPGSPWDASIQVALHSAAMVSVRKIKRIPGCMSHAPVL